MSGGARAALLLALPNQTHRPHRRLRLLSSLPRGARQRLGSNRRPSRGLLPAGRPPGTAVPGSYQGPRAWSSGDRAAKHLGGFGDVCRSLVHHLWVALSSPPGQQLCAGTGRSALPGGFWGEAAHPWKNPSLPGHERPQLPVICPRQRLPALAASSRSCSPPRGFQRVLPPSGRETSLLIAGASGCSALGLALRLSRVSSDPRDFRSTSAGRWRGKGRSSVPFSQAAGAGIETQENSEGPGLIWGTLKTFNCPSTRSLGSRGERGGCRWICGSPASPRERTSPQSALAESFVSGAGKGLGSHAEPLGSLLGGRMLDIGGQEFSLHSTPNLNCITLTTFVVSRNILEQEGGANESLEPSSSSDDEARPHVLRVWVHMPLPVLRPAPELSLRLGSAYSCVS